MQRLTLLEYRNYRHLKASALLMAVAILAYAFHHPSMEPYGGTWLSYTLGCIGALIVSVQLWYGIHKRRIPNQPERRKPGGHSASTAIQNTSADRRSNQRNQSKKLASTQLGWLSAHVYFGISLIVIVTLHSGFQFGWNVQTLAYVLLMAVIGTGVYGAYSYIRFPRLMTENMGEDTLDTLLLKISDLNKQAFSLSLQLSETIREVVLKANQETRIGGNLIEQLTPDRPDCQTGAAIRKLQTLGKELNPDQAATHRALYAIMLRKETLVRRARRDVMLRAKLELWLYFHVPLAIALVSASIAHVVSIFFYW